MSGPALAPQRIALYGGTFDPIHSGHLILALDALEKLALDRVIFIPAALSPHKLDQPPTPAAVRRAMLAAAIAGEPRFAMDDSELHRSGPSYTFDTVTKIRAQMPGAQLYYLIGEDNVAKLFTWYRIEELRALTEFVVLNRHDETATGASGFLTLPRRIDISATEIRERVARGQSIRYFVPEPVRELIATHHLYQDPPHKS